VRLRQRIYVRACNDYAYSVITTTATTATDAQGVDNKGLAHVAMRVHYAMCRLRENKRQTQASLS